MWWMPPWRCTVPNLYFRTSEPSGEGLEIAILGQIHFLVIYYLCCANTSKNCIISAVNVFERRLKETPIKDIQISVWNKRSCLCWKKIQWSFQVLLGISSLFLLKLIRFSQSISWEIWNRLYPHWWKCFSHIGQYESAYSFASLLKIITCVCEECLPYLEISKAEF